MIMLSLMMSFRFFSAHAADDTRAADITLPLSLLPLRHATPAAYYFAFRRLDAMLPPYAADTLYMPCLRRCLRHYFDSYYALRDIFDAAYAATCWRHAALIIYAVFRYAATLHAMAITMLSALRSRDAYAFRHA